MYATDAQALSFHKGHEPPMTPPHVSGVSMAPLAGVEFVLPEQYSAPSPGGAPAPASQQPRHQRRQSFSNGVLGSDAAAPGGAGGSGGKAAQAAGAMVGKQMRPSTLKLPAPSGISSSAAAAAAAAASAATDASPSYPGYHHHPHHHHPLGRLNAVSAAAAAAAAAADASSSSGPFGQAPLQFMAEGRAVTLTRALTGGGLGPAEPNAEDGTPPESPDINLAHYREINDADSLW